MAVELEAADHAVLTVRKPRERGAGAQLDFSFSFV